MPTRPQLTPKKTKEKAIACGNDSVNIEQLEQFDKQYDEIIKTAYAENPIPETTKKTWPGKRVKY